jgi:histidine triad (HIT) family protein
VVLLVLQKEGRTMDCIFCKIAKGEFKTEFLYESKNIVAFRDINPMAPVHILIIPKKHITDISNLKGKDFEIIQEIMQAVKNLAEKEHINNTGYRVFSNTGEDAGQIVKHLHFHLVGGKKLGEAL